MRALRTIPVLKEFARDIEEVCPDAYFLNYTNPMAMLIGYVQRYTKVKTIGLCHSVQTCSQTLLKELGMEDKLEGRKELIAGINHMGWLLELKDKDGNDLYPEIKCMGIICRSFIKMSRGSFRSLSLFIYSTTITSYSAGALTFTLLPSLLITMVPYSVLIVTLYSITGFLGLITSFLSPGIHCSRPVSPLTIITAA